MDPTNPAAAAALAVSTTVFVGNLPFDVSEEQLAAVFSEVGPVKQFVIKYDNNTGRSKGFGFCHYYDHDTALSAVRNLYGVQVSGRNVRVELSTDEPVTGPAAERRGGGGGGGSGRGGGERDRGGGGDRDRGGRGGGPPPMSMGGGAGGWTPPMGAGRPPPPGAPNGGGGAGGYGSRGGGGGYGMDGGSTNGGAAAAAAASTQLPPGQPLLPGQKATDAISKTLSSIPAGKLEEVLLGMKTLVQTSPEQARAVLSSHPQLAYALFQAMLLMNVVDPAVLSRIQPIPNPAAAAAPPPPPVSAGVPPRGGGYPSQGGYGAPPAPSPYGAPPPPAPPQAVPPSAYGATPPQRMPYASTPQQQQHLQGPPAPPRGYGQPAPPQPPQGGYPAAAAAPAAPGANLPPQVQAALSMVPEAQKQMLLQVLQLAPEQINALPPDQKASVMQLRTQFGM